jgi:hypothetical protein
LRPELGFQPVIQLAGSPPGIAWERCEHRYRFARILRQTVIWKLVHTYAGKSSAYSFCSIVSLEGDADKMKKALLLAGTAFLGLAAFEPAAHAQRVSFSYTGSAVTYTVPKTGLYQIIAYGAQGGSSQLGTVVGAGGRGAEIGGNFNLTAGEALQIAVGGVGADNAGLNIFGASGGGGGGSFVVGPNNTPLVIAGGGGGGGAVGFAPVVGRDGGPGLTGPNGEDGTGLLTGGTGGTGGGGGGVSVGFFTAGAAGFSAQEATHAMV